MPAQTLRQYKALRAVGFYPQCFNFIICMIAEAVGHSDAFKRINTDEWRFEIPNEAHSQYFDGYDAPCRRELFQSILEGLSIHDGLIVADGLLKHQAPYALLEHKRNTDGTEIIAAIMLNHEIFGDMVDQEHNQMYRDALNAASQRGNVAAPSIIEAHVRLNVNKINRLIKQRKVAPEFDLELTVDPKAPPSVIKKGHPQIE